MSPRRVRGPGSERFERCKQRPDSRRHRGVADDPVCVADVNAHTSTDQRLATLVGAVPIAASVTNGSRLSEASGVVDGYRTAFRGTRLRGYGLVVAAVATRVNARRSCRVPRNAVPAATCWTGSCAPRKIS